MLPKLADGAPCGSDLNNIEFDLVSEEDNHDESELFANFINDFKAENRHSELEAVCALSPWTCAARWP